MDNQPLNQMGENEMLDFELEICPQNEEKKVDEPKKSPQKQKNKGKIIYKSIVIILLLITLAFSSAIIGIKIYSSFEKGPSAKLSQIHKIVKEDYFGEIDESRLEDSLANAYMEAIGDKYAFYKNAEDGEMVEDSLKGNSVGIGITIYNDTENNALAVFRVDSGSPADKAGIKIGDKIIAIDGKLVADEGFSKSISSIAREVGQTAEIKLLRDNKEHTLKVVYKDFIRQSVYYEVVQGYGFVTITAFNEATVKQFEQAYDDLTKQKVKGFIFDLRDNSGGTVKSVCAILDTLLGECDLITYVYADGSKEVDAVSDAKKCELPMAVLVNEQTASAAELFSANLRDVAKAPLIGNNTFGKGVVQRTYFLGDGSCVRFTVGEFLPAGGVGFNGKGLAPDCEVSFTKYEAENRFTLGENDPYLKKAIEQLNKFSSEEK